MKTKIPDAMLAAEVSRRGLVKTTAIGGLAVASSAFTLPFTRMQMLQKPLIQHRPVRKSSGARVR